MESIIENKVSDDLFQIPVDGYWRVKTNGEFRAEYKLLPIDSERALRKLEFLDHRNEVFQHVSKVVFADEQDPSLWQIVGEVLLKLEEIKNQKEVES